jgi:DNA-binding FadR family transcriptional regulator
MRVRTSGTFERRSAESIARAIELEIINRDLAPGTFIGSEAHLMEQYAASRGVIREAVTLVESHMLAETRRGVGGGLVVAEPEQSVVEDLVSLYLARKKASEGELLEARLALEVLALRKTMAALDERGLKLLQEEMTYTLVPDEDVAEASQRFHKLIATLSGNTVLQVFIPTMTALVEEMWVPPGRLTKRLRAQTWHRVAAHHAEIITAMLHGDTDAAVDRLVHHLEDSMAILRAGDRRLQVNPLG